MSAPAKQRSPAKSKEKNAAGSGRQRTPRKRSTPKKKAPEQKSLRGLSASGAVRARRWVAKGACLAAGCALVLFVGTILWVGTYRFVNPPMTGLMMLRHLREGQPIDKIWRNYAEISPHLLLAVLAAEDQRFYDHHGFDLEEIKNAIEARQNDGRMRGASTLSQQTAKNVFLWPTRSWWRKGMEAYFTVLTETLWSKRRILEVYVNVAELGPGIYGVESAARHYFNVSASELTPEQSALLASILPSPLTRDPRTPTAYMKERQAWLLTQMNNLGGVDFLR